MIEVEVPGAGVVEFPDDTPDHVIDREVRNTWAEHEQSKERSSLRSPTSGNFWAGVTEKASQAGEQVFGRISLGGLGDIAGAVATDLLTQPMHGLEQAPSMRATAAELFGEEIPADIRAKLDASPVRRGLVGAARMGPTVGAGMIAPWAMPVAFGAAGFEEGGREGDLGAAATEGAKQAAIGALLPVAGKVGRVATGALTGAAVNRGVGGAVLASPAVQKALEFVGSQTAVQVPMIAHLVTSPEYKQASPEQRRDMLTEFTVANAAFAVPEAVHGITAPRSETSRFESPAVALAREGFGAPARMALDRGDTPPGTEMAAGGRAVIPELPIDPWPTGGDVPRGTLTPQVLPGGSVIPGSSLVARPREAPIIIDPGAPEVIPVTRNVRQDPVGGKVSFDAEAPTLLRNQQEHPVMRPGSLSGDPIPEDPAALSEQLRLTADPKSTKAATLFTPGETVPPTPEGMQAVETPHGTVVFNPSKTTAAAVTKAGAGELFDATILGQSSAEPVEGKNVVTTHTDAAKNVVTEIVPDGDPKAVEAAVAAQQAAVPGGTTEVKPAIEVARERVAATSGDQQPERTGGGTDDLQPKPVTTEVPQGQPNATTSTEGVASPAPSKDPVESWLERKIAEQPDSGPGVAYSMPMFSPTIYLRAALSFYRTGKPIVQAVDEAIDIAKKRGLTAAEEPRLRAFITAGMPSVNTPPPSTAIPANLATPPQGRPLYGLNDFRERFTPNKKQGTPLGEIPSGAWNRFVRGAWAEYNPASVVQKAVEKAYGASVRGKKWDYASFIETLAGARGQAKGDILAFDRDIAPLIKGVDLKDFNAYMLAERTIDRLRTGARTGKNRQVGDITVTDANNVLAQLEAKYGPERMRSIRQAGGIYNAHMDTALNRMVTSGRMSQETYDAIKDANSFYAPFRVLEWMESDTPARPGEGRRIDTQAELTKKIEGIKDTDFKLGDILGAGRMQLVRARVLAEKANRMAPIGELAAMDTAGKFIRPTTPDARLEPGRDRVAVFDKGDVKHYDVPADLADALGGMDRTQVDMLVGALRSMTAPARLGATGWSLFFQARNLPMDQARLGIMSKMGVGGKDFLMPWRYPMDVVRGAIHSAISNRLIPGFKETQKYMEFLDSGASGSNPQANITPIELTESALMGQSPVGKSAKWAADWLNRLSSSVEEATKMTAFLRAMRQSKSATGKDLPTDLVTEVRRYGGSPDFSRSGDIVRKTHLNDLFTFSNARMQGQALDIIRLLNAKEPGTATAAWARLAAFIGVPTATIWAMNHSPQYAADFAQRTDQEKRDYWLIPKENFIKNSQGERVRDFWKFKKKDIVQQFANSVEAGLEAWNAKDPKGSGAFFTELAESVAPVNVSGRNARERLESVGGSMAGPLKAPIELMTGRNMYLHRDVVPDTMKQASPEQQFKKDTPEFYKRVAWAMPKAAPEFLRSPLWVENITRNITASMIDQFLPKKAVEGRSGAEASWFLRPFQTTGYVDNPEMREQIDVLKRKSADEYLARDRAVTGIMDAHKDDPKGAFKAALQTFGPTKDRKGMERFLEKLREQRTGTTPEDKMLLGLSPDKRAEFIVTQMGKMDRQQSLAYLRQLRSRKVLSDSTAVELKKLQMQLAPPRSEERR